MTTDRDRLLLLAKHLDDFASPGFTFGEWEPSWTDANKVIHVGWYRLSPAADAFMADVAAGSWVTPFDWPAWLASDAGQALYRHPEAVAQASAADLGRLLTSCVRGDRFSEGTLAAAYESGLLTAILRRAQVLAEAQ